MDATVHPEHRSLSVARAMVCAARAFDLPDLSAAAQARLKICQLDFLSCAFEARDLSTSRQAVAAAARMTSGAAIVGSDVASSTADAAFANATLGHGLVREDMQTAQGAEVEVGFSTGGRISRRISDVAPATESEIRARFTRTRRSMMVEPWRQRKNGCNARKRTRGEYWIDELSAE